MKGKTILALWLLSGSLLLAWRWQLVQKAQSQQADLEGLAWSLRLSSEQGQLSDVQQAYLEGHFEEALGLLAKPGHAADRDLQSSLFRCLLFDIPWPQQVLLHEQLEASEAGRPLLLVRVVQSGTFKESKPRLDYLSWDGQACKPLKLEAKADLKDEDEWLEISELETVHLDRKDAQQSQLWVLGRTSGGKFRLEVLYGFSKWRRWVKIGLQPPKKLKDRVEFSADQAFKLVDDEWIEVR